MNQYNILWGATWDKNNKSDGRATIEGETFEEAIANYTKILESKGYRGIYICPEATVIWKN